MENSIQEQEGMSAKSTQGKLSHLQWISKDEQFGQAEKAAKTKAQKYAESQCGVYEQLNTLGGSV